MPTRIRGWRSGRRPIGRAAQRVQQSAERSARHLARELRRRLTANAEAVLRDVFGPAHQHARDLRGIPAQAAASTLRTAVLDLILQACRQRGLPEDSLGAEVDLHPRPAGGYAIGLRFLMPEHSDQDHLRAVVRELAAKERGS